MLAVCFLWSSSPTSSQPQENFHDYQPSTFSSATSLLSHSAQVHSSFLQSLPFPGKVPPTPLPATVCNTHACTHTPVLSCRIQWLHLRASVGTDLKWALSTDWQARLHWLTNTSPVAHISSLLKLPMLLLPSVLADGEAIKWKLPYLLSDKTSTLTQPVPLFWAFLFKYLPVSPEGTGYILVPNSGYPPPAQLLPSCLVLDRTSPKYLFSFLHQILPFYWITLFAFLPSSSANCQETRFSKTKLNFSEPRVPLYAPEALLCFTATYLRSGYLQLPSALPYLLFPSPLLPSALLSPLSLRWLRGEALGKVTVTCRRPNSVVALLFLLELCRSVAHSLPGLLHERCFFSFCFCDTKLFELYLHLTGSSFFISLADPLLFDFKSARLFSVFTLPRGDLIQSHNLNTDLNLCFLNPHLQH